MGGFGFLITYVAIAAVYLGYSLIAILGGMFIQRELRSTGTSTRIAVPIGIGTTLILFAIPFWDYPLTRLSVNEYCDKEGGFHISRTVSGIAGIHGLPNAIDFGYLYGEDYRVPTDVTTLRRFYQAPTGSNRGRYSEVPTEDRSPYGFRRKQTQIKGTIFRLGLETYTIDTGEELGRFVFFQNIPNSSTGISINDFRPWMKMSCPGVDAGAFPQMRELLRMTLQPVAHPVNKAK